MMDAALGEAILVALLIVATAWGIAPLMSKPRARLARVANN